MADLLQVRLSGFENNDRAIVYCLERKWAEEVTGFLNGELGKEGCGTHHAEIDLESRAEI